MEVDPKHVIKRKKFVLRCLSFADDRKQILDRLIPMLKGELSVPFVWPIFDIVEDGPYKIQERCDEYLLDFIRKIKIEGISIETRTANTLPKHHEDIFERICFMQNGCKPEYPKIREYLVIEMK